MEELWRNPPEKNSELFFYHLFVCSRVNGIESRINRNNGEKKSVCVWVVISDYLPGVLLHVATAAVIVLMSIKCQSENAL